MSEEITIHDKMDGLEKLDASIRICGCLAWERNDPGYTVYRGTDIGRVSAVGPGGIWICVNVSPNQLYRLQDGFGWNCSCPPR